MNINTKSKRLYFAAGLAALLLAPISTALGRPEQCIKDDTKCDYELLCAFKVELAEKMILFKTFVANSPRTKAAKKSTLNGVKYDGALYALALAEAKKEDPSATGDDLAALAYSKFAKKVKVKLDAEAAQYQSCKSLDVTPKSSLRGTWTGMRTSKKDCTVYGEPPNDSEVGVSLDDVKKSSQGCLEISGERPRTRGHSRRHLPSTLGQSRATSSNSSGLYRRGHRGVPLQRAARRQRPEAVAAPLHGRPEDQGLS